MADDFTGVPDREWHEFGRDAALARMFSGVALLLGVLVVLTLIEKGVLSGWGDLVRPAR